MAQIKVDRARLLQIRDQLPEMKSIIRKDMDEIASNLEVIKKVMLKKLLIG